ncbi:MAG: hypothetical protein J6D11_05655 [Clostridia bacterium]|mgnify:CR=1 FL=1|nr:hypothetical protein [Clostridia bacterium]
MNIEIDGFDSIEDASVFIAILVGMAIFIWIIYGIIKLGQSAADSTQPILTEKARLIEKAPSQSFETKVLFETERGERVRLRAKVPNNLVIGDEGMLTWQGGKIIKFERNTK